MVTCALVYTREMGDDGEMVSTIHRDNIPHTKKECTAMLQLAREEWPTLW